MALIHATAVVIGGAGVLLRGRPGAGKSDLALRLIRDGATLVADDYVEVAAERGRLVARPPETIRGLLEVRGVGLVAFASVPEAVMACIVDLTPGVEPERLPDPAFEQVEGISLRVFRLDPFTISAAAKVAAAVTLCNNPAASGADAPDTA